MKYLIDERKTQYKANLHCHTVLSDGKWTPEQVKKEYKKRGYSVVAITDHERLVDHSELNDGKILFLTAYEMYIRKLPFDYLNDSQVHINLYSKTPKNKLLYFTPNHTKYIPIEEFADVQYHKYVENREHTVEFLKQTIAFAKECGFLVCHNHPTWSFENEDVAESYDGCFAMEIYNHGCYTGGYCEYNQHYYDYQLNRELNMALIAADDNHNEYPIDDPHCDSFGGVTYILADKLDYETIVEALENREFYASTGPQIHSLTVENGELYIKTSAVKQIWFVTNNHHRKTFIANDGGTLTQARFTMNDTDKWVRVEAIDEKGNHAFTRAFRKEEILK